MGYIQCFALHRSRGSFLKRIFTSIKNVRSYPRPIKLLCQSFNV